MIFHLRQNLPRREAFQFFSRRVHGFLQKRFVIFELGHFGFGLEFLLKVLESFLARFFVHFQNDASREINYALQVGNGQVQQKSEARRHAPDKPDMRNRRCQLDVPHPLPSHYRARHLYAAFVADDAFIADAAVFSAIAFVIALRPENSLVKKPVFLGALRPVIDGFGFGNLAPRPG